GFGDRGAARGGVDHRLPAPQPSVAQRVQVQRTREAVLEAAGGMGGLVLEVEIDAREARELELQQMGVCRPRGLLPKARKRLPRPLAHLFGRGGHRAHAAGTDSRLRMRRPRYARYMSM